MKKILLTFTLFIIVLNTANAQIDYCKDIKRHGAADVSYYNTPLPNWKEAGPTIRMTLTKLVKQSVTVLQGGLCINTAGNGETVTNVSIGFEDGDQLDYRASDVIPLPKQYGTYSVAFTLSNSDMDKLRTKRIKSFSFLGLSTSDINDAYKDKMMAYANCFGSTAEGSYLSINPNASGSSAVSNGKAIEGFWGIKFGSSMEDAKSVVAGKGGILNTELSTSDRIAFTNIVFTDRKLTALRLRFVDGKFFEAALFYPKVDDAQLLSNFSTITSELEKVYGTPKIVKDFQKPYFDGDGFEVFAIKSGKAKYYAVWKSNNNNTVQLEIESDGSYTLYYSNRELENKNRVLENKKEEKRSTDY